MNGSGKRDLAGLVETGRLITTQRLGCDPPARREKVKQSLEACVVRVFEQVQRFEHDNVLEALGRHLRQPGVEADSARSGSAASPAGFHLAQRDSRDPDAGRLCLRIASQADMSCLGPLTVSKERQHPLQQQAGGLRIVYRQ